MRGRRAAQWTLGERSNSSGEESGRVVVTEKKTELTPSLEKKNLIPRGSRWRETQQVERTCAARKEEEKKDSPTPMEESLCVEGGRTKRKASLAGKDDDQARLGKRRDLLYRGGTRYFGKKSAPLKGNRKCTTPPKGKIMLKAACWPSGQKKGERSRKKKDAVDKSPGTKGFETKKR